MLKKSAIIIALFLLITPSLLTAQESKTISVANLEWLPYSGRFLENHGVALEIITAAFQSMGYNVDYNFMSWTLTLEEVKAGNYDAVATAYYTDERAETYQFSESYLEGPIVFFKRKDTSIEWNGDLKALKDYRIGVVKGYANSPEFDSADYLDKVESTSEVLLLKKIIYKQADLIVLDKFAGFYNMKEKLFGADKRKLEPIDPPLTVNKLYMMFSKSVPGYLQKTELFNRGLAKIKSNGTYDRIISRYGF